MSYQSRAERGLLTNEEDTIPYLRFNWGPENVHFGKTHFRDPNIDFSTNYKNAKQNFFFLLGKLC